MEVCLKAAVGGNGDLVAFPSKVLYQLQDVKPYNMDVAVHPVAVTYPKTADQVSEIVKCATATAGYTVQPRGGGHSYANYALGGGDTSTIVVDLKNFVGFSMDTNSWEATIGGGTRLEAVTKNLLANGNRAMAHGTCPDVGIGGHATMGGLGPTSRMWGSAMDHVLEYEVVLANSSIVKASATKYPEVFWAMKGAGASFGIVTNFRRFKDWQTLISNPDLSRKFASQVVITAVGMIISGTFFGTKAEFDALNMTSVFPDNSKADVIVFNNFLGAVAHWAEDVFLNLGALSASFYSKNLAFTKSDLIPATTIDAFFKYLDTVDKGTLIWFAIFDLEGGAINDIAPSATAYGHRDALFYLQTYGVGITGVTSKIRNFITGMNDVINSGFPGKTLGAYAGYVDPALPNPQQRYFGSNLPELERLKKVLDPKDIFHNPQSIRPAK
ncbi:putative Reticuline oxidase-like protein [Glarea lozoyensis 74030]|uniref:Putative Reticuline oxidase-like protein n=1 Tax=Glarea lozoyensis (strain ATCC 74030 / MF5533) TaxID=1104152 RepID=H0EJK7_GLAL7|nr:putative Reticuline oxidase-like protein [Glarea lozoyensis 74030]